MVKNTFSYDCAKDYLLKKQNESTRSFLTIRQIEKAHFIYNENKLNKY